jgi:hypothetical protein
VARKSLADLTIGGGAKSLANLTIQGGAKSLADLTIQSGAKVTCGRNYTEWRENYLLA